MKLLHLADLHLGKRVNGFPMLEDQRYILERILAIVDAEAPQAVLIAGDVYDRTVPPEEAVDLFDGFLVGLAGRGLQVYIISGNHDSAGRVAFGGRLMDASGIHLAPVYNGTIAPLTLSDEYGPVAFWLIPFLKPAQVRRFWPDDGIETYTDAVRAVIAHLDLDSACRNVALVHQFVAGAAVCDSEEHTVGGLDEVAAAVFAPFAYTALGHLHSPQSVGSDAVRYAGSPLKYSFSEADQKKGVTVVELGADGVAVRLVPLQPRHDLRRIRGLFDAVTDPGYLAGQDTDDYCEITLLDEEDVPSAQARLRACYPNLMALRYDNTRTRSEAQVTGSADVEHKTPLQLLDELYDLQNGQPMSEDQRALATRLITEIWEETL